jgi:hypothetical protein
VDGTPITCHPQVLNLQKRKFEVPCTLPSYLLFDIDNAIAMFQFLQMHAARGAQAKSRIQICGVGRRGGVLERENLLVPHSQENIRGKKKK